MYMYNSGWNSKALIDVFITCKSTQNTTCSSHYNALGKLWEEICHCDHQIHVCACMHVHVHVQYKLHVHVHVESIIHYQLDLKPSRGKRYLTASCGGTCVLGG